MQVNNSLFENLGNGLSQSVKTPGGNQLSQDDFIKLLLTQLKLQSPTNPFDSNTMMQQISQLTTLSATHELEQTIKNLNTNMGTSQVLEASHIVGKKVQVLKDTSPLIAGEGLKGSVVLPDDVDGLTVTIKDAAGKTIKTIELGASSAGVVDFAWDGLDAEGKPQSPGFYTLSANASIRGETVSVPTAGTFTVNSVALDRNGKGVILNLEGIGGIGIGEVIKILS
ncbi:FlgD immunoglobulin-like domain containing protein [Legionella nagasakiensis]|uniref:FlgD immunoglobulin-like domain containing protein n=1 Tax=Legionella nagasakiensis TaxID=535290 RepID=UPI0010558C6D|nr:FlgD immunoglobulin-like domain containing protein [Legionella nagasakiensis]